MAGRIHGSSNSREEEFIVVCSWRVWSVMIGKSREQENEVTGNIVSESRIGEWWWILMLFWLPRLCKPGPKHGAWCHPAFWGVFLSQSFYSKESLIDIHRVLPRESPIFLLPSQVTLKPVKLTILIIANPYPFLIWYTDTSLLSHNLSSLISIGAQASHNSKCIQCNLQNRHRP